MSSIKAILFDFGGVILNIDFRLSYRAFAALGGADFDTRYTLSHQDPVFDRYERGLIQDREFIEHLNTWFPDATPEQIMAAWNAMLLDFPPERFQLLKHIRKHYPIYLLSNSCSMHYRIYTRQLQENYGLSDWNMLFDRAFFSHFIGLRKPDAKAFGYVLEQTGFQPQEMLFIDDSATNTDAAQKLGFHTCCLDPKLGIGTVFTSSGTLI